MTQKFSSEFTSSTRKKGHDYADAKLVRIISSEPSLLEAIVQGTTDYGVRMLFEKRELLICCTCPYFESGYLCKHLWAVLIVADRESHLEDARNRSLRLLADYDQLNELDAFEYSIDEDDEIKPPDIFVNLPRMPSDWRQQLGFTSYKSTPLEEWPSGRRLIYVIDVALSEINKILTMDVMAQDPKKSGELSKPKPVRIPFSLIPEIPDETDRQILAILNGSNSSSNYGYYEASYDLSAGSRYLIRSVLIKFLLPLLCKTGRVFLRNEGRIEELPVQWDEGPPWEFFAQVRLSDVNSKAYKVLGFLRRGETCIDLTEPVLVLSNSIVFFKNKAAPLVSQNSSRWIPTLRSSPVKIPKKQISDFLKESFSGRYLRILDLPEELSVKEIKLSHPQPCLTLPSVRQTMNLAGHLSFIYQHEQIIKNFEFDNPEPGEFNNEEGAVYYRDMEAESVAQNYLNNAGFKFVQRGYYESRSKWEISPRNFPHAVRKLIAANWRVEAEGKLFRSPGQIRINVASGIDWFDLDGSIDYGGVSATLPELLAAAKKGNNMLLLSDGTYGILPEDWLQKYSMIVEAGETEENHIRFRRNQAALLSALLASQPEAQVDKTFDSIRKQMLQFDGIREFDPPDTFQGELRHYQKTALGWIRFLRQFKFGGILADDMGLGKTVTILALLEERLQSSIELSQKGERMLPSLVVVPKSLVFNWKLEAARFTPNLRVLDHTGISRKKDTDHFEDFDLVLTTYGTLRNDAVFFKDRCFDYIILDEAQAIKNADTASAMAARLLQGNHKLALSGTPVENHLSELWSLFEFLNPGMLGSVRAFQATAAVSRSTDDETRKLLAQALRPFILRRTKQQVLKELPPKTEQTIYCELEAKQRKLYEELRHYYRNQISHRIEIEGINRSKFFILEALLRLRQAACHSGLIDAKRSNESSGKLEILLEHLSEVIAEGHKVLVFSQFTSFLSILKQRLYQEGIPFEYLDGKTKNRQEPVDRFQNNPDSRLFLISLKAGGLGLNLTAADYVYLLDPWWNPVAETQAVDRAYRIGQTRSVFAYRFIAQNTVEEKVLELQQTKRDLADAIINADNSLIRNLQREDLELLLT
ncbi:DEAD/DEAH box helicase [bacterium]|nr:DEAD/DEAH box helicase [bacterium]